MDEKRDGECLFSFELFVNRINYVSSPCYIPAIAFRLLDYPTVIMYFISQTNIQDMRQKLGWYSNKEEDLLEITKLKDESGGFEFKKGKSCLFRHLFSSLNDSLQNVPLYVMLLDSWAKKPKLIASCMIPLCELIEQIRNGFRQFGENCPAVGYKSGRFDLCNLMGTRIGKISLELKLTCYGESLLHHVQLGPKKDSQINVLLNLDDVNVVKHRKTQKQTPTEIDHVVLPSNGDIVQEEGAQLETRLNCDEKMLERKSKKDVSTQRSCKARKRHNNHKHFFEAHALSNENFNVFCPPPLCLNLHEPIVEKVCNSIIKPELKKNPVLNSCDDLSSDEEPQIEILKPVQGGKYYKIIHQHKGFQETKSEEGTFLKKVAAGEKCTAVNENENIPASNLSNLPVLTALLQEITNLLNPSKLVQEKCKQFDTKAVQVIQETTNSNTEPIFNQTSPHVISHTRTENLRKPTVKKQDKKKPRKGKGKCLPPKKNLTYGFTRTQQLRYNLTHQNEPLPRNSIELHENLKSEYLDVNLPQFVESENHKLSEKPQLAVHRFDLSDRKEVIVSNDRLKDVDSVEQLEIRDESKNAKRKQIDTADDQRPASVDVFMPTLSLTTGEQSIEEKRGMAFVTDVEDSFHGQLIPQQQPGFHSPVEPRAVTLSELGMFDDQSPWTSITKSGDNLDDYDDELFHSDQSDDAITVTSSVSLPKVSGVSNNTDYSTSAKGNDSITSTQSNFQTDRPLSRVAGSSSSPTKPRPNISPRRSSKYSSRTTSGRQSSNYSSRTNSSLNRLNSSANSVSRVTSEAGSSEHSSERAHSARNDTIRQSHSSHEREKEFVSKEPKKSSYSPVKSKIVRKKNPDDEKLLKQSVSSINSSQSQTIVNSASNF